MFVELIEYLRCPNAHQETLLVAAASQSSHRHIVNGVLGCPACNSEFPVIDGVARFAPVTPPPAEAPSVEIAMRLAAFLELTDARAFAILTGTWASHATPLADLVDTPLVLVNPARGVDTSRAAAVIECATLPIVDGSARALAFDPAAGLTLDACLAKVRRKARVLSPATAPVPAQVTELARDARDWVGETNAAPEPAPRLVPLQRAR